MTPEGMTEADAPTTRFERYKRDCLDVRAWFHPEWRAGQTCFNLLGDYDRTLAEEIRGTHLDPFYRDSRIQPFLDHVQEAWGDA